MVLQFSSNCAQATLYHLPIFSPISLVDVIPLSMLQVCCACCFKLTVILVIGFEVFAYFTLKNDSVSGVVVRVPGYSYRGLEFDFLRSSVSGTGCTQPCEDN
jgi:hypothetical protein